MKKTVFLAAMMAFAAWAVQPAFAADMKVAVLDSQQAVNSTNAAKRAMDRIKASRAKALTEVEKLEAPLVEKKKKLMEQQKVMAPDKFAAEEQAFQKDIAALNSKVDAIRVNLDKEQLDLRRQIETAVKGVVEKIAKERGYDMVLPKALVIYSNDGVADITKEVVAQSNAVLDK
ncbi:MAG: OmpH family outer membrane protein [Pseudomonadaceae bacterium]|nr:OmpH family outer membrane protein [Pseudomonadaceae bacterium]